MTLQEILKSNGVADDAIEKIVAGMKENKIFTSSEENLDIRYGKLKGDYDNLTTQHEEATKLIEELKKGTKGNEDLQGKVTAYEGQIENLKEQLKQTQIDSAVKVALISAKASDIDYMTFKLKEKGELELAEDGTIKGMDDKISGLKTQFPNQFEKANARIIEPNRLPTGKETGGTMTKAEFLKKSYNERAEFREENPEQYAEIMKG